jgi:glycosyltransferase involved in cell wall biosynthesis
MKPLCVAMIISCFHPRVGGAERQVQQLASSLLQNGVAVHVLTRRPPGLARYEEIDTVPVHRVTTIGRDMLASLSYTASSLMWLSQHRLDLDVLHCHQPFSPMTIGLIARALWGKPVIVKLTTSGSHGNLREIQRMPFTRLRKRMMQHVDRFVAISEETVTELRAWGIPAERIVQIPNGVDTERFAPPAPEDKQRARKALGLADGAPVVAYVGRFTAKKRVDVLLQAWQSVHRTHACARLLLVGDGPERPALQALTDRLHLGESSKFCGTQPDVLSYLHAADIFVLPSVSEGLSNALLEAMACGLPPVACDIGGNRDVIQQGESGVLVQPDSAEALAAAISTLLERPDRLCQLANRARNTVLEHFSLHTVTGRYLALYSNLRQATNQSPSSVGAKGH